MKAKGTLQLNHLLDSTVGFYSLFSDYFPILKE